MRDLEPFAFAGLREFARIEGEELLSATIVVGSPNPLAATINDRLPISMWPAAEGENTGANILS